MDRGLVILLHGVGSNGANMAALGRALAPSLPALEFESPDAPHGSGPHREWFSVIGITEANRPGRVVAARPGFDAVIAKLIEEHGFSNALDRVVLLGFSQGSIMALDALASGRWHVGAVVAFSGRLASPMPLAPAMDTRLLLVHGDADPIMPPGESVRAAELLTAAGVRVRISIEPGLGHQVSTTGLAEAAKFLNSALA
ncbi:esterase [Mesorhizobium sp. 131-3-5]|uniref:alpha/beta hydrolase n=1 Tax=Mesorhizobium sp. 131-3-5 TaxID=2744520 RepID=UPI001925A9F3|nr:prolyl oligopeptidase family serine peptidase [Mesorhizobium sp. 131-3-5]BCH07504.1 esterase [Mesorhizobium sp. 131-3-5]